MSFYKADKWQVKGDNSDSYYKQYYMVKKTGKMKKGLLVIVVSAFALFFSSCQRETGNGALKLSLTDSPVDSSTVSGVYITITSIEVNTMDGWKSIEDFSGPQTYNLLDLRRGESDLLGSVSLDGGVYTQVRFMLDAPEKGTQTPSNPGCYIEFNDGENVPLFVPSGHNTGYKGVGEFIVPVNDTVRVTADFDLRKSVVKAGKSGKYILKPTIRLIVENQAGSIRGEVINIPQDSSIVIYAYTSGSYKDEEADDPETEDTMRFPNAVSSDIVDQAGIYHLAFLAQGSYDLIITTSYQGTFGKVVGIIEDTEVQSLKTTTVNIDMAKL